MEAVTITDNRLVFFPFTFEQSTKTRQIHLDPHDPDIDARRILAPKDWPLDPLQWRTVDPVAVLQQRGDHAISSYVFSAIERYTRTMSHEFRSRNENGAEDQQWNKKAVNALYKALRVSSDAMDKLKQERQPLESEVTSTMLAERKEDMEALKCFLSIANIAQGADTVYIPPSNEVTTTLDALSAAIESHKTKNNDEKFLKSTQKFFATQFKTIPVWRTEGRGAMGLYPEVYVQHTPSSVGLRLPTGDKIRFPREGKPKSKALQPETHIESSKINSVSPFPQSNIIDGWEKYSSYLKLIGGQIAQKGADKNEDEYGLYAAFKSHCSQISDYALSEAVRLEEESKHITIELNDVRSAHSSLLQDDRTKLDCLSHRTLGQFCQARDRLTQISEEIKQLGGITKAEKKRFAAMRNDLQSKMKQYEKSYQDTLRTLDFEPDTLFSVNSITQQALRRADNERKRQKKEAAPGEEEAKSVPTITDLVEEESSATEQADSQPTKARETTVQFSHNEKQPEITSRNRGSAAMYGTSTHRLKPSTSTTFSSPSLPLEVIAKREQQRAEAAKRMAQAIQNLSAVSLENSTPIKKTSHRGRGRRNRSNQDGSEDNVVGLTSTLQDAPVGSKRAETVTAREGTPSIPKIDQETSPLFSSHSRQTSELQPTGNQAPWSSRVVDLAIPPTEVVITDTPDSVQYPKEKQTMLEAPAVRSRVHMPHRAELDKMRFGQEPDGAEEPEDTFPDKHDAAESQMPVATLREGSASAPSQGKEFLPEQTEMGYGHAQYGSYPFMPVAPEASTHWNPPYWTFVPNQLLPSVGASIPSEVHGGMPFYVTDDPSTQGGAYPVVDPYGQIVWDGGKPGSSYASFHPHTLVSGQEEVPFYGEDAGSDNEGAYIYPDYVPDTHISTYEEKDDRGETSGQGRPRITRRASA